MGEQVAPFLIDTAATEAVDVAGDSMSVDSCMLPILSRFEGLPHVIPEGQLVYLFPSTGHDCSRRTAASGVRQVDWESLEFDMEEGHGTCEQGLP